MLEANQKVFEDVESRYYFAPIKKNFWKKNFEEKVKKVGAEKAISYLTEVMQSSTAEVEEIIQKRIKNGEINDALQNDTHKKKYNDSSWDFVGANTKQFTHCYHSYPQ